MKKRKLASLIALAQFAYLPLGYSQGESSEDEEEIFELSPFEVDGSEDRGYRATNTLNGSRLNTALADTPGAISVMTREFLDDIGATDLESMLIYDVNYEPDFVDTNANGNSNETELAANGASFRSRGIEGSLATDGFRSAGSGDSYNIERVGTSRGPNAILFGTGSAGGVVNFRTKRAYFSRDTNRLEFKIGEYGLRRASFDFNRTLIEDRLGIRLLGLAEEKDSHRPFIGSDKKSFTIASALRIKDGTTLNVSYEETEADSITARRWGMVDRVSRFQTFVNNGEVVFDDVLKEYRTADGSSLNNGVHGVGNQNRRAVLVSESGVDGFTLREGSVRNAPNDTATIGNFRTQTTTNSIYNVSNANNNPTFVPLLYPNGSTTSTGTAERGDIDISKFTATLSHKVMDGMYIELAYNKSKRTGGSIIGRNPQIRADLNFYLPDGVTENPFFHGKGYFFSEQSFFSLFKSNDHETKRFSWSYEKDFGERLGFHRFAILAEEQINNTIKDRRKLVWADSGIAPNNTPENNNNLVFFRNYFRVDGDPGDIRIATPPTINDPALFFDSANRTEPLTTGFSISGTNDQDDIVTTKTKMFVMQNYFMDRRLVTTLGIRDDALDTFEPIFARDPVTRQIRALGPEDGEDWFETFETDGDRTSIGAVFHLNKNRNISLTANKSEGLQLAERNKTVLPFDIVPEPVSGEGEDFGINFSFFENRISGSLKWFESSSIGEAENAGKSAFFNPDSDIIDHFINKFSTLPTPIEDLSAANLTPLQFFDVNGPFSVSNLDELSLLDISAGGKGRLTDRVSEGFEFELAGRITNNWDIRFNLSKTDTTRSNLFLEGEAWFAERQNLYQELDAFYQSQVPGAESLLTTPIDATINDNNVTPLQRIEQSDEELARLRFEGERGFGSRPLKINLWTRYNIKEGPLKKLAFGGGWRFNDNNNAGLNLTTGEILEGSSSSLFDFFASYKTKGFFGMKKDGLNVTYQLNVRNLFDDDTFLSTKEFVDTVTGEQFTKRGFVTDPRMATFTLRLDF